MLGAHREAPKVEPAQQFADTADVEYRTKPGFDALTQIGAAPAHHPVRRQIGALLDPGI